MAERPILVCTAPPIFTRVPGYLQCILTSGGHIQPYWITWHDTQIALPTCAEVFDAHLRECSNVASFPGAGAHPPG
jgi:hypothetical protein